jgi:transcriptional regulator GlxA family with amidase domain
MSSIVRALLIAGLSSVALVACGTHPPPPPPQTDAQVQERRKQDFVDALKPRRTGTPTVAILASNEGTEMSDLLLPHAVLQRSGAAQVRIVAPHAGRIELYPALQVEGALDFASFERAFPAGPDYVIVPAMADDDDIEVTGWLREQADRGALIIAVCSGARVAGQAGLLDGRRFTGHWYDRGTLLKRHPGARYVPHQRYLFDRGVATTTGITASLPASLALVEALAGPQKARALADELGLQDWTPDHDSSEFGLDAESRLSYLLNKAAFWRSERLAIPVVHGTDDAALALVADAWSRTGRVQVEARSSSGPVTLRSGLVLLANADDEALPRLPLARGVEPVRQLDRSLCEIGERYGTARRDWVMQEMEYPRGRLQCGPVPGSTGKPSAPSSSIDSASSSSVASARSSPASARRTSSAIASSLNCCMLSGRM